MQRWMFIASPFALYGVYLIGSGQAWSQIADSHARVSCNAAAKDAGVPYTEVSSACSCVDREVRRWNRTNPGVELSASREAGFRNTCFAAKIGGAGASPGRNFTDDMHEREEGNDWVAERGEYEYGSDWN